MLLLVTEYLHSVPSLFQCKILSEFDSAAFQAIQLNKTLQIPGTFEVYQYHNEEIENPFFTVDQAMKSRIFVNNIWSNG
jgi:hypothetical protein